MDFHRIVNGKWSIFVPYLLRYSYHCLLVLYKKSHYAREGERERDYFNISQLQYRRTLACRRLRSFTWRAVTSASIARLAARTSYRSSRAIRGMRRRHAEVVPNEQSESEWAPPMRERSHAKHCSVLLNAKTEAERCERRNRWWKKKIY